MIDNKKQFFSTSLLDTDLFNTVKRSDMMKFVLKESFHTQNYQAFFRWGYNFFCRNVCLKCTDFILVCLSCAENITSFGFCAKLCT